MLVASFRHEQSSKYQLKRLKDHVSYMYFIENAIKINAEIYNIVKKLGSKSSIWRIITMAYSYQVITLYSQLLL